MKKIRIITLACAGLLTASCDFLNVDDYFEDTFSEDKIFDSQYNIERYFNGAVNELPKDGRIYYWCNVPGATGSDEAVSCGTFNNGILDVSFPGTELTTDKISYTAMGGWDWDFNVWPRCYKVIRKVNTILPHIDEVPEPVRAKPEPVKEAPAPPADEVPFDDSPDDFQDEPIPDDFDDFSEVPPESGSVHTDVPPQADSHSPVPAGHSMTAEPPAAPEPAVETGSVAEPEPVHRAETALPQPEADELKPILIRVLEDLPEFAGPDRDYRLSKEDLVMLPRVLAEVLINTEKAVLIRPTP